MLVHDLDKKEREKLISGFKTFIRDYKVDESFSLMGAIHDYFSSIGLEHDTDMIVSMLSFVYRMDYTTSTLFSLRIIRDTAMTENNLGKANWAEKRIKKCISLIRDLIAEKVAVS